MSENPPAYPPPPPSSVPPPPPGQPVYQPPPGQPVYQPPPGQYPQQYAPQQPYQYQPGQPYGMNPVTAGIGGAAGLISQFSGRAAWSCGIGLVTIVAPFVVHFVFYLLALVGLLYGVQAIRRGQLIGGIVGIALNIVGGLLTIVILTSG